MAEQKPKGRGTSRAAKKGTVEKPVVPNGVHGEGVSKVICDDTYTQLVRNRENRKNAKRDFNGEFMNTKVTNK